MNNYLVIGSGGISDAIAAFGKERGQGVEVVPLRDTVNWLESAGSRLGWLHSTKAILYCGYDHFSIASNLQTLSRFVAFLSAAHYAGRLVFFNSQGAVLDRVARATIPICDRWLPDRYVVTKRWQSKILKRSGVNYVELYLPLVTGLPHGFDTFADRAAKSPGLRVPSKGMNRFYFLAVKDLLSFLFTEGAVFSLGAGETAFVYSEYLSFCEYLEGRSRGQQLWFDDIEYGNCFGLPPSQLIRYVATKLVRNIASTAYYALGNDGYLGRQLRAPASPAALGPLSRLTAEECKFYSYDFNPPDALRVPVRRLCR